MPTRIGSQSLKPLFCDYVGSFAIESMVPQLNTFHMDLHPPTHVQLNKCSSRSLRYVAFECHANFRSIGNHTTHRDQPKKRVLDMLPLNCIGDHCQVLVCEPIPL